MNNEQEVNQSLENELELIEMKIKRLQSKAQELERRLRLWKLNR